MAFQTSLWMYVSFTVSCGPVLTVFFPPQQLADIREVEGFSAIIYSRFESQFV